MTFRSALAISALFTACALLQGCGMMNQFTATANQTQHVDHVAGMPVVIESRNGGVEVIADQSRSDVEVVARITCSGSNQQIADERLSKVSLSIARDAGRTLVIKPVFPGGEQNNDGAAFTVRLPDAQGVTIKTSNGKAAIRNLSGQLRIDTSNASAEVIDCPGPANITTSNGSVKVAHLKRPLTVRTSNGSVNAEDVAGTVDARTSNGSISLTLAVDQSGPIHLITSNASIKAKVGPAFSGIVKMATSNASIKIIDPTGRIKASEIDDDRGRVTIGAGGEDSMLDTSNGKIELVIEG